MEDVREKLKCETCGTVGTTEKATGTMSSCKHLVCSGCITKNHYVHDIADFYYNCSVCSRRSSFAPFPTFLLAPPEVKKDHFKCTECEKPDSEQDMFLCEGCNGLKFKDLEEVKKNVLCSTCSIKNHSRKGHNIVDFYPYLRAYDFSEKSAQIEKTSFEMQSMKDTLVETFTNFNVLTNDVSENYKILTDLARRSKSSKQQRDFFNKMETFHNETKLIESGTETEMKKREKMLETCLGNLKTWLEEKKEDCVENSEIIKIEDFEKTDDSDADSEFSLIK